MAKESLENENLFSMLGIEDDFQILSEIKVDEQWENEFVERESIQLCKLYYPPFNFQRTGCKGCPFTLHLQEQLDILAEHLPNERKMCEVLWKPVYDEYRRLGYRLRSDKELNLFDFDYDKEEWKN